MTPWASFSEGELACRCGCGLGYREMDGDLMDWMQAQSHRLRSIAGRHVPIIVTSAARCEDYDNSFSAARAHTQQDSGKCHALDVQIEYPYVQHFLDWTYRDGVIWGVGTRLHGPYQRRFVHIDNLPKRTRDYITKWSYQ